MNIKLYSKWGELPLTDNYPDSPDGLLVPGAELQVATSDENGFCYLFQELKTRFFTIRYCCFYSSEKDSITVVTNTPGVTFRLSISHSHHMITKDLGIQAFHERGYNLFFDPSQSAEYPMEPYERYIFLDILPEDDYLLFLQYYFPTTEALMEKAAAGAAGKLALNNQVALTETWTWQEALQDWCFDSDRASSDGDIIGNKLIEKCIQSVKPATTKREIGLTPEEINGLCDAAEIIRSSDDTLAIHMLAAKAGLSAYKFNAGFKEIFGHPAWRHKFEDKMSYALRLLDCKGVDLEQLAGVLGYSEAETFSREFRRRFGYAPFEDDKCV